ncbi:MAG: c-type cytochrome [Parvularculaceae bacterium]
MLKRLNPAAAGAALFAIAACGDGGGESVHGLDVVQRDPNSSTGRELFVQKGCVICHSVNGVGGKAAPSLDAGIGAEPIDPLDFAARMWWGAPAMIELQSVELGYAIHLTADDIVHLAAFAGDAAEQKKLALERVPEPMRDAFLDERFWEVEDWNEFLRQGQEGVDPPEPDADFTAPEIDEPADPAEPREP